MKVGLEKMQFYAFHGFYDEEQKVGQSFEVTVYVEFDAEIDGSDELTKTFNYEWIYEVCAAEMKNTRRLLETVAFYIAKGLKQKTDLEIAGQIIIRKPQIVLPLSLQGSYVEYSF